MSVNWLWKDKIGEVKYFSVVDKKAWHLDIYACNGLCCFIYNYKEDGKEMYNFFTFFNDLKHAKRVLEDDKDFFKRLPLGKHKFRKITLFISSKRFTNHYKNELLKLAKLIAENKCRVELK